MGWGNFYILMYLLLNYFLPCFLVFAYLNCQIKCISLYFKYVNYMKLILILRRLYLFHLNLLFTYNVYVLFIINENSHLGFFVCWQHVKFHNLIFDAKWRRNVYFLFLTVNCNFSSIKNVCCYRK